MKDQHTKIKGYRDLSQEEIDLMNEGKALAEQCGTFITKLWDMYEDKEVPEEARPDPRWIELGQNDLQKGFMGIIRSIAKPTTF